MTYLQTIEKVAAVDEAAARELVRMTLFDALCDLTEEHRPRLEREFQAEVAKRSVDARRALVRDFIDRRLDNDKVDDLQRAAVYLTAVEVSKVYDPERWDPEKHPRGILGRFRARNKSQFDAVGAFARSNGAKGQVQSFTDKDRWSQLNTVGRGLSAINAPGAKSVGVAAQVVGNLGPEAQRVLDPTLRRAAYRYRGTERRPDAGLVSQVSEASNTLNLIHNGKNRGDAAAGLKAITSGEASGATAGAMGRQIQRTAGEQVNRESSPVSLLARRYLKEGSKGNLSVDQVEMSVSGDLAASYLQGKLPNSRTAALSLAAGAVPPSQGVIINAEGEVTTEAMGFKGDHYLPFDLKNLGELRGGQYVRTRLAGGPTTEDIYTGLLGGARQMQVVSNSGVFTVELDPDLRGGRRYSDKAKQMVSRYGQLLDTLDGNKGENALYQQDIPADRKQELRRKAIERAGVGDPKPIYDQLVERERRDAEFAQGGDEDLDAVADAMAERYHQTLKMQGKSPSNQEIGRYRDDTLKQLTEEGSAEGQVKRFQLDGEGYAAALGALKQEFPYFIRDVRYEPLREFEDSRGLRSPGSPRAPRGKGPDRGYVRPGQLHRFDTGRSGGRTAAVSGQAGTEQARVPGQRDTVSAPVAPTRDAGQVEEPLVNVPATDKPVTKLTDLTIDASNPKVAEGAALLGKASQDANGWELDVKAEEGSWTPEAALPRAASSPQDFTRWLVASQGSSDDAMNYLLDPKTDPKIVAAAIKAITAQSKAKGGKYQEDRNPLDDAEVEHLTTILSARAPWSTDGPVTRKQAMSSAIGDKPPLIAEINDLGTDPARYEQYAEKAPPLLKDAIEEIDDPHGDFQGRLKRLKATHDAVVAWGGDGERPANVPANIEAPAAEAEKDGHGEISQRLEANVTAWSWKRGRDLAELFGGGAAPFVKAHLPRSSVRSRPAARTSRRESESLSKSLDRAVQRALYRELSRR